MTNNLLNNIKDINKELVYQLVNNTNYNKATNYDGKKFISDQKLIFPKCWENGRELTRISEQEPRILYCKILDKCNYHYSIDTPNKGKTKTNLSLYAFNKKETDFNRLLNIEFKADNPDDSFIYKDVKKIFNEKIIANWFHILKNADSRTLKSLFNKLKVSFITCFNEDGKEIAEINILLSFCILEKRCLLMKHFNYSKTSSTDFYDYADNFFTFDYRVKNNDINIIERNNWDYITSEELMS